MRRPFMIWLRPTATMGSLYSKLCSKLCSKISTHEGGHTVLNNNTLGGEADGPKPSDPRTAAAEAAQRRVEAVKISPTMKNSSF